LSVVESLRHDRVFRLGNVAKRPRGTQITLIFFISDTGYMLYKSLWYLKGCLCIGLRWGSGCSYWSAIGKYGDWSSR
jgi:hypothetical protein